MSDDAPAFSLAKVRKRFPTPWHLADYAARASGSELSPIQSALLKLAFRSVMKFEAAEVAALRQIVPQSFWQRVLAGIGGKGPLPRRQIDRMIFRKGRRAGGTTRFGAPLVVWNALQDWEPCLAPGERPRGLIVAPRLEQARAAFDACTGLLTLAGVPYVTRDGIEIDLTAAGSRNLIRCDVADNLGGRGFSVFIVLFDECFHLNADPTSVAPDREVVSAVVPSLLTTRPMARTPGVIAIGSPTTFQGFFHEEIETYLGNLDSGTFCGIIPTWVGNPALTVEECRKLEPDETRFRREFMAEPTQGEESFIDVESVTRCVDKGITRRRWDGKTRCIAGLDAAFAHDNCTLVIGHREIAIGTNQEQRELFVTDVIEIWEPTDKRLDFHETMAAVAHVCQEWGSCEVVRDSFDGAPIGDELAKLGVHSREVPMTNAAQDQRFSDLARRLKSSLIRLVDNRAVVDELLALRKKTTKRGQIKYEAPTHGAVKTDDVVDALCLAAWEARMLEPGGDSAIESIGVNQVNLTMGQIRLGRIYGVTDAAGVFQERIAPAHTPERRRDVYDMACRGQSAAWWTEEDRANLKHDLEFGPPAWIRNLPDMSAPSVDDKSAEVSREYWKTMAGTRNHPSNVNGPSPVASKSDGDDWWRKNAGVRSHPTDGRLTKKNHPMKNTKPSPSSSSASRAWLSGSSSNSDSSSRAGASKYGLPSDSAMMGGEVGDQGEDGLAKMRARIPDAAADSSEHSDSASESGPSSSSGDSSSSGSVKVSPYSVRPIPPTRPRSNSSFRLKK